MARLRAIFRTVLAEHLAAQEPHVHILAVKSLEPDLVDIESLMMVTRLPGVLDHTEDKGEVLMLSFHRRNELGQARALLEQAKHDAVTRILNDSGAKSADLADALRMKNALVFAEHHCLAKDVGGRPSHLISLPMIDRLQLELSRRVSDLKAQGASPSSLRDAGDGYSP